MLLVRLLFCVVLSIGSINAYAMGQMPSNSNSLIGNPAPDVSLPNTDGTVRSVISSRNGGKAILVFWASWCPHCRDELKNIRLHFYDFEQAGIKIILVNSGESKEEINAYLTRHQIPLTSFIDEENVLQDPYQLIGLPTVVFINANGQVLNIDHQIPSDFRSIFK